MLRRYCVTWYIRLRYVSVKCHETYNHASEILYSLHNRCTVFDWTGNYINSQKVLLEDPPSPNMMFNTSSVNFLLMLIYLNVEIYLILFLVFLWFFSCLLIIFILSATKGPLYQFCGLNYRIFAYLVTLVLSVTLVFSMEWHGFNAWLSLNYYFV